MLFNIDDIVNIVHTKLHPYILPQQVCLVFLELTVAPLSTHAGHVKAMAIVSLLN